MKEQSLFEVSKVVEYNLSDDSVYDLPQTRLKLLISVALVSAVAAIPLMNVARAKVNNGVNEFRLFFWSPFNRLCEVLYLILKVCLACQKFG
jgi:hypothetical protein